MRILLFYIMFCAPSSICARDVQIETAYCMSMAVCSKRVGGPLSSVGAPYCHHVVVICTSRASLAKLVKRTCINIETYSKLQAGTLTRGDRSEQIETAFCVSK